MIPAPLPTSPEQEHALAVLRQIVEDGRTAHMTTNVDLLLAHQADPMLVINAVSIAYVTRAETLERFTRVFAGAVYQQWDFLEPPIIRLAHDASVAWVISRVRVRRTKTQADGSVAQEAFTYAGLDTYELRDGVWLKTANVSTFEED